MPRYTLYSENRSVFTKIYCSDDAAAVGCAKLYKYDKVERVDHIPATDKVITIYEKPQPYFLIMGIDGSGNHKQYSNTRFTTRDKALQRLVECRERRERIAERDATYDFVLDPLVIVEVTPDS